MQALHAHGTHIYVGKHSYRIKINKALLRKNLSIEHWLPKEEMATKGREGEERNGGRLSMVTMSQLGGRKKFWYFIK